MRICTIAARNYLPQARVLTRSYAEHNRFEPCSVLLLDDPEGTVDEAREPFEIVRPEQLGFERYEGMAAMYDLTELAAAVKPWLLRYLLARDRQPVAYFDPDIRFFDEVDEIAQAAVADTLVLTPHLLARPIPDDDLTPTESDLLAAGTYSFGFVALAAGQTADRLLAWWCEQVRCGEGRWFDRVTSAVPRSHVLRDPGANVAYWNLHERRIERDGDRYTVNGQPLRFFHFSGFDPARPFALSRHQTRVRLPDEPVIAGLCDDYAAELRRQGFDRVGHDHWIYEQLADGTPLTPGLRGLYAEGERAGAFGLSPFTEAGTREFIGWCKSPRGTGAGHGPSRLALAVYDGRPDLQLAFPDLDGDDGPRFAVWIAQHRRQAADLGLPPEWLPAPPPGSDEDAPSAEGRPWGVNVAGYLRSELGVGEAARTVVTALDARGVPVMPVHGAFVPNSRQGHAFAFLDPAAAPFPVNLICVNADELPAFLTDAGPRFSEGRYTIGFWWWEVTTFPERSVGALDLLDEVWVGTMHVAEALEPVSPVPVVKVRIPVTVRPIVPYSRAELGLPEGFLFFFMFDFHSVIERKNPMAAIEAFRNGFEPGSGASLVIKSINRGSKLDDYDRLRFAARGHPDVHLIDRYVSASEKDAMLAASDCYVSLHRSEGFGLTPAEAMYLGKPVIATGYSGNLDYMTSENSYLVDYTLRGIGDGNFPYPAEGEWAEPDSEHAARLMREVAGDPVAAQRRGRQAALDIRRTHSPDAAGETMERRLADVREHLEAQRPVRHAAVPPATARLNALQDLIAQEPTPLREGGGIARRLAFRAAMRVMRPVIRHQREVADRLASELARLDEAQLADRRQAGSQIAIALAELRRHDQALATTSDLVRRVTAIEAETHAIPYMEGKPFRTSHEPGAGVVLGYGSQNGPGRAEAYRAFEDVFRGAEDMIRERMRRYLAIIDGRRPVLDIGCGRGELLDVLRDAGLSYAGVDTDEGMVARCREKGHTDVAHGDGIEYLDRLADASLGVVFAAQVIEHLTEEQLRRLLALARRKLAPGGLLIAETVNPHSPPALKTFWVDLTHRQPIFPEVALELCREAGFESAYFFHPNGTGNVERDRFVEGEFAVVARAEAAISTESARPAH